jgi:hypothetical protein
MSDQWSDIMTKIMPENVMNVINDPQSVKILSTSSGDDLLHSVPLGSLAAPSSDSIVFGKILMNETHSNLEKALKNGSLVSVLVVRGKEAYQIRCRPKTFYTDGPTFQAMRGKLPAQMPLHGVWLLEPSELICQTPGPDAGKRL